MTRLILALVLFLVRPLAAQSPQEPAPPAGGGDTPGDQTAKPAVQEDAASAPAARSPEMQVTQTDAGGRRKRAQ